MPQEFHAVRCFSCKTFQVQIIKKVNKYQCKMCGEKQSTKKVYAKGSGKDCRLHVQKLNQMRVESQEQIIEKLHEIEENSEESIDLNSFKSTNNEPKTSKWAEYIPEPEKTDDDTDTELVDSRYTFERPKKKKSRGRKAENNAGKNTKKSKYNYNENLIENEQNSFREDPKHINQTLGFKNKQKTEKITKWNDFETFNENKQNVNNYSDSDNEDIIKNAFNTNVDEGDNYNIENNEIKEKKETKINNSKATKLETKEQKPVKKSKWDTYVTEESDDGIESNEAPTSNQITTKINDIVDHTNLDAMNEKSSKVIHNESIKQISKKQIFKIHESDDDLDDILDF